MLFATSPVSTPGRSSGRTGLPRRSWANWALLAGTFVLTTVGLSLIIATLLPERLVSPWPWVRTDLALVVACLFLVLTLVLHLTNEQRHIDGLNEQFIKLNNEVHENARRRLYALLDLSRVMGMQSDPQNVFDCITKSCVDTFHCDQASLMLFNEQRRVLVVRSAHGHQDVSRILGHEQPIGQGIAGWAALHEKPLIIGRETVLAESPELKLSHPHLSAAIVVPIILRDELVGVVNISSRSPDVSYDEDDMRALKVFAENAGTCIRNTERAQWMRTTIESLQEQLARAQQTLPS
ncbi:MAG TPA: GAF domain-containing protein [Candidatus Krumholzibacteria bacterium]|nr:GAF domain-containing protein [Candidatus Krumholzibacteria bacterium]